MEDVRVRDKLLEESLIWNMDSCDFELAVVWSVDHITHIAWHV